MDLRALSRLLEPVVNRLRLLVGRGHLTRVNDATAVQTVQAVFLAGETHEGMERLQQYGFTSHPHPGGATETLALFVGGDRGNGVVICAGDRQYRLRPLAEGEVALYDDLGQVVHLRRGGILIDSPLNVTVRAGEILRLEGREVHLHAQEKYRWDVNGHGQVWWPNKVDSWTIGAVGGQSFPISPAEIEGASGKWPT
jgi:phage baseplate assembly protein V